MKIYGYSQEDPMYEKLLTMQEICLDLQLEEIDELIEFLKFARERHGAVADRAHETHTHYEQWKTGTLSPERLKPDIIISTIFEENPVTYADLKKETL